MHFSQLESQIGQGQKCTGKLKSSTRFGWYPTHISYVFSYYLMDKMLQVLDLSIPVLKFESNFNSNKHVLTNWYFLGMISPWNWILSREDDYLIVDQKTAQLSSRLWDIDGEMKIDKALKQLNCMLFFQEVRFSTVRDSTWISALPVHSMKCQKALVQVTSAHARHLVEWSPRLFKGPVLPLSTYSNLQVHHFILIFLSCKYNLPF